MKKLALSLLALSIALVVSAAPRRVVLVVQNHCTGEMCPPMSAFADTLVAELSGEAFRVVNPDNVIGINQNRSAAGEKRPDMSAVELARTLNAEGVVTASVQELKGDTIGVPPVAYRVKVRVSISLADAVSGETICGVNNVDYGKNVSAELMKEDDLSFFETQIHDAAKRTAAKFLAKASAAGWGNQGEGEKVTVFFGCNVLGADVQIDGLSYGTCPAEIEVTPGIHTLEVSYSAQTNNWYHPFKRTARFVKDGQTFAVVLQPTEEGEKSRRSGELFKRQETLFSAELSRYKDVGKVEDFVRRTIAEGVSVYWKNSCGRLVITDGKAEKIEMATPITDSGTLQDGPSSAEIGAKLHKLLEEK